MGVINVTGFIFAFVIPRLVLLFPCSCLFLLATAKQKKEKLQKTQKSHDSSATPDREPAPVSHMGKKTDRIACFYHLILVEAPVYGVPSPFFLPVSADRSLGTRDGRTIGIYIFDFCLLRAISSSHLLRRALCIRSTLPAAFFLGWKLHPCCYTHTRTHAHTQKSF